MDKSEAVCAKEALELLNCVTGSSFDQEKCINLLNSLRKCVLEKKVKIFKLADEDQGKTDTINKKHG